MPPQKTMSQAEVRKLMEKQDTNFAETFVTQPTESSLGIIRLGNLVHEAVLPIELSNSNTGRGFHWASSNKRRKVTELSLRVQGFERKPFAFPVKLAITRILGKRQQLWDYDSVLRGSAKDLIDSLVQLGWFVDDGPKWVKLVVGLQDETQRSNGRGVRIQVFK